MPLRWRPAVLVLLACCLGHTTATASVHRHVKTQHTGFRRLQQLDTPTVADGVAAPAPLPGPSAPAPAPTGGAAAAALADADADAAPRPLELRAVPREARDPLEGAAAEAVAASVAAPGAVGNARLEALADDWRLTPAQAAAIGQPDAAGKIRICVSSFAPEVVCSPGDTQDAFQGYQVELFKEISRRVYWLGDARSWAFSCLPWRELLADLASPNGTCMVAPAGMGALNVANPSWVVDKEGLRILTLRTDTPALYLFSPFDALSWQLWLSLAATAIFVGGTVWVCDVSVKSLERDPLPRRGKGGGGVVKGGSLPTAPALVRRSGKAAGGFGPRCSLGGGSSVLGRSSLGGRCLVTGGGEDGSDGEGLFAIDVRPPSRGGEAAAAHKGGAAAVAGGEEEVIEVAGEEEATDHALLRWLGVRKGEEAEVLQLLDINLRRSLLKFARMSDPPITMSLPAQVILFTYGLLLIIVIALYTAGTAARLTAAQLGGGIRGRDDLKGLAVGTWSEYVDRLHDQGLPAIGMPWDSDADEEAMLDRLRSGELAALVLDRNVADHLAATRCEFAAVGLPFSIGDVVYGLALGLVEPLRDDLDRAIRAAVQSGVVERYRHLHVLQLAEARCNQRLVSPAATITLGQVAGLWVMLGLSLLAGLAMLGVLWAKRRRRALQSALQRLPSRVLERTRSLGSSKAAALNGHASAG
ncbi:MAG: hypothetical protein J3K34DRAFT_395609 [Monoraphidium minutum]|nr:MAG: hypothetical protein J3K34DRAFT_395609 [Monoraphidium minutum]